MDAWVSSAEVRTSVKGLCKKTSKTLEAENKDPVLQAPFDQDCS